MSTIKKIYCKITHFVPNNNKIYYDENLGILREVSDEPKSEAIYCASPVLLNRKHLRAIKFLREVEVSHKQKNKNGRTLKNRSSAVRVTN